MTAHKALCYASLLAIAFTSYSSSIYAQINQNLSGQQIELPNKLLHSINKKSEKLNAAISRSTDKYLRKLRKAN
jgi:hypothetical protein